MNGQELLGLDDRLSSRMRVAEHPGLLHNVAAILAHSADSWFWLLGLGLLWWWGSGFWKERAVALILGVLLTAGMVLIIKFGVRRRRPEGEWGDIYRKTDPHSFPSGHAARAVMLAVVGLTLGPYWFGLLLLTWAPLVGVARVALGVHYLGDILVGMILGGGMGFVVLSLLTQFAS